MAFTTIDRSTLPAPAYLTPDIDDMVALGIQSPIHYNGLVLNDRLVADRYLITNIDGLGAPDVRDNRAVRPAEHGEVAYDAYFGGSTITIAGTIQAGSLHQATRMERDLRAAFSTLIESPMKFSWWDVHDDFSDAAWSSALWTPIQQLATFPGDGTMQFTYPVGSSLTNPAELYYALRQYIDQSITVKFTVAPTTNGAITLPTVGVIAKATSNAQFLHAIASTTSLSIVAVSAGAHNLGTPATLALTAGEQYWLRLTIIGDELVAAIFQVDPRLNLLATALGTVSAVLTGLLADTFGYQQQGFAGVEAYGQNATQISVQDWRVDAIWPCDMVTNVRSITAPAIKATVATPGSMSRFKRDFQLTVRASNPRITQPTMQTKTSPVLTAASSAISFGRVYPRAYPLSYNVPIDQAGNLATVAAASPPLVECVNRGTWLAQPIITVYGGLSFPAILNDITGEFIVLDGTIANGDYVVINIAQHTLVNSSGNSVFSLWDPLSSWLQLRPGINRLILSGQSPAGSPKMTVAWANTWK